MMTEEQRYLFDLCGFLHLENVLTPEELDAASDAANRYIDSAPEDLPPHFGRSENLKGFAHGFAFDRALEKLVFLPAVWPIVLELTNGKPMLASGYHDARLSRRTHRVGAVALRPRRLRL